MNYELRIMNYGVVPLFVGVPREFCGVFAGFEVVELPGVALFN
jgi:hypothetical protein